MQPLAWHRRICADDPAGCDARGRIPEDGRSRTYAYELALGNAQVAATRAGRQLAEAAGRKYVAPAPGLTKEAHVMPSKAPGEAEAARSFRLRRGENQYSRGR